MTKTNVEEFLGTGRRKCSVARVRLSAGNGNFTINEKDVKDMAQLEYVEKILFAALKLTAMTDKVDVRVNVYGGGVIGQAGAIALGIARALEKMNPDFRPAMKAAGMMTRDSRVKERKKPGQPGARKRFQFSKR